MRTKSQREAEAVSKTTIRLPDKLLERAKIHAVKERRTLQDVIADALEAYLKASRESGR
jgi:predicted transcriptional regulator